LALAHQNLGNALAAQGQLDAAIAACREAIRLKPEFAEAHYTLGLALQQLGRFVEGATELEQGHALGSRRLGWRYPSAEWVRQARRLAELDRRLPALLQGQDRPTTADELLGFADLCSKKQLPGASARFWNEAFQAQPALAEDMKVQHRYNAACAAALAGSGQGRDDPPLDSGQRARWRTQALAWLQADMASWTKVLETDQPASRVQVRQVLQHWRSDPDLAGLRDQAALGRLPEDEQKALRALWAEVEAVLARASCSGSP
jgi:tetratricopeptide (TPR) repeat protein